MLALLIGLVTVVIGCWLSDNCWSPEPDEPVVTVAWPSANSISPPKVVPLTPNSALSASTSSSRPSSPDSDWPLVDVSDGDSMNLWHHALCNKISNTNLHQELFPEVPLQNTGEEISNEHVCHQTIDDIDEFFKSENVCDVHGDVTRDETFEARNLDDSEF